MEESGSKKQTYVSGAVAMFMLVCAGLICVAGIQYFRSMKYPPVQAVQEKAPRVIKGPPSHLRLRDIPEQKIFIGFKDADRMYMDVSELCEQPGFRTHADNRGLIEAQGQDEGTELLFEVPDVTLPSELANRIWWIVSGDAQPEERIFDMPYQWLSYAHSPVNGACLFLGKKSGDKTPQKFHTDESEPVIGLMGYGAPLDLHLVKHQSSIEVTKDNRTAKLRDFPWLLAWLHKFSSKGAENCGPSDGFMPTSKVLPIKAKISPDGQQDTHWFAATGCDVLDRWSLVMANEDGTTSFITTPPHTDNYWPVKAWTADIDNDGVPEFLIKAQYYEGERYVLLRLDKNPKGGYYLTEIAGTSYEGL